MQQGCCFDGAAFEKRQHPLVPFSPPALQAGFELGQAGVEAAPDCPRTAPPTIRQFESLADDAWKFVDKNLSPVDMPVLSPADLTEALAGAALAIEQLPPPARAAARLRMRGGLQITGVYITDRPED